MYPPPLYSVHSVCIHPHTYSSCIHPHTYSSPLTFENFWQITVEQPSPEGARTSVLVGQTAEAEVPVTVKPVDARPEMTILLAGHEAGMGKRAGHLLNATLDLTTKFADIIFCGGAVACKCPATALACVKVEDADSCEAKADRLKSPYVMCC